MASDLAQRHELINNLFEIPKSRDEWERFMATVTEWDLRTYMDCLP